ncbi:hypothetical protein TNCV_47461 [Trichonephila clavipes]|nr:hypothetical protein TNCV_47461 [Trichonephila clavipes]
MEYVTPTKRTRHAELFLFGYVAGITISLFVLVTLHEVGFEACGGCWNCTGHLTVGRINAVKGLLALEHKHRGVHSGILSYVKLLDRLDVTISLTENGCFGGAY